MIRGRFRNLDVGPVALIQGLGHGWLGQCDNTFHAGVGQDAPGGSSNYGN